MTTEEIFEFVAAEVKRQQVSKTELASRMGINPSTVQGMYKRKNIPLHRLLQFTEILNYNFFQLIADGVNITNPLPKNVQQNQPDDNETILKLQGKVEMIQELYEQALADKEKR